MKQTIPLSKRDWTVAGWMPEWWRLSKGMETGVQSCPEVPSVPAKVPGSVQSALLEAGVIPDWNVGMNYRLSEWVENLHWIYETTLPDVKLSPGKKIRLKFLGLDYCGTILVNGNEIGTFKGSFVTYSYDITEHLTGTKDKISVAFECAPRWLGQAGYTTLMTEWKPRFNYTWDWCPRLVQTAIWDEPLLEIIDSAEFEPVKISTDANLSNSTGILTLKASCVGDTARTVRVTLKDGLSTVHTQNFSVAEFANGVELRNLPIKLWNATQFGDQPLYGLTVELLSDDAEVLDKVEHRVGFKHLEWLANEGAVPEADPWICSINGQPLFLQGVNWTPIRPNFADVKEEDYRLRLVQYRDLGCNLMRIWGGAFLEKQVFYELCDELGILVWQEFPLSSSGLENWPPEDEKSIEDMAVIAKSYLERRRHHVSLIIWCGGNELQGELDGRKTGGGLPVTNDHPLIGRFKAVCDAEDPGHRFLPTSSSGPRFYAAESEYGKGLHWDVHGPWTVDGPPSGAYKTYWDGDDSLFRSETGAPGASPVDIIEAYAGEFDILPGTKENPLWRRTSWWIEWDTFTAENGHEAATIEEYVAWSQARQAEALAIAVGTSKRRFPACGGILLWMGHDCFPCTANTAVIDFWGRPKPAALAVSKVFLSKQT